MDNHDDKTALSEFSTVDDSSSKVPTTESISLWPSVFDQTSTVKERIKMCFNIIFKIFFLLSIVVIQLKTNRSNEKTTLFC